MSEYTWLTVYCIAILIFSLSGAYLPFIGKVTHNKLQFYLSISAGVMLGASFFHVMPDAMKYCGNAFGWWMSLGVVGLFCIERFIAPHSHELDGGGHHAHSHHHHENHGGHTHAAGDEHVHVVATSPSEHRAAAPAVAGWMAVLGLTIHTFMNGVGLAGAVQAVVDDHAKAGTDSTVGTALLMFPGIALFLAIVLHKPADALAISMVVARKGASGRKLALVPIAFGAMVPVGVVAFLVTRGAIEKSLESQLTGAALAFSAGTFLFIALSDLLPEVQFHKHDRLPLFAALLAGVVFMGFIALLEPPERGEHEHSAPGAAETHSPSHDEGRERNK